MFHVPAHKNVEHPAAGQTSPAADELLKQVEDEREAEGAAQIVADHLQGCAFCSRMLARMLE